jgi:hypothetical protein
VISDRGTPGSPRFLDSTEVTKVLRCDFEFSFQKEECIWLKIPRYGVLVAVLLIEPGTCHPLKRLRRLTRGKLLKSEKIQ